MFSVYLVVILSDEKSEVERKRRNLSFFQLRKLLGESAEQKKVKVPVDSFVAKL